MVRNNPIPFRKDDAVKQFITKHEPSIVGVLSGWDRIRFRGTIRTLAVTKLMMSWLWDRQVMLKHFKPFALELTATLKVSVEEVAAAAGRTVKYLASSALSKEDLVQELIRREGIKEGLVCVLSCVELCQSYDIHKNRETKHIDLVQRLRKCLHWYCYFLDRELGLCHVRIQSWLPFNVHICVNGREWLCRGLEAAGVVFRRSDNCLVHVADAPAAQRLLDAQPWANWQRILNGLVERACPALRQLAGREEPLSYYWSADETEWATDVMFRSPRALAELYPALIGHAMTTFSSREVMRFLGRTRLPARGGVDVRFNGQVTSDLSERPEGLRIKHRMNHNSIKMYDKQGSVLRIETTINDARDLSVYRTKESDPQGAKKWQRLRKGVVDLPRRAEISQAANTRYLAALAEADAGTPLGQAADAIRRPVIRPTRRFRGLNPLSGPDAVLAQSLLRGEFAINGFRNRDIRRLLHPKTGSAEDQRRQSSQISRLLRLFREHHLVYKIKGTHRYQLTAQGRRMLPAFTAARNASTEQLNQLAA
jgi:hypothetical protein